MFTSVSLMEAGADPGSVSVCAVGVPSLLSLVVSVVPPEI